MPDSTAAMAMPSHMLMPRFSSSALASIAPMPTNSECASEIWPVSPPTMFHAEASAA